MFGATKPEYGTDPHEWTVLPSPHGGYRIKTQFSPGFTAPADWYWQCNLSDPGRIILLTNNADDAADFHIQAHPMGNVPGMGNGYVMKSREGLCVCAEPMNHSIHLLANRAEAREWERFFIEIVGHGIVTQPPPTVVQLPFQCEACHHVFGYCSGGSAGQTCYFYDSPVAGYSCPNCGKEYYRIGHTHR